MERANVHCIYIVHYLNFRFEIVDLFKAMDVSPFHSVYGVQKYFITFSVNLKLRRRICSSVFNYMNTQHYHSITSNPALSITICSIRKDSPFCINSGCFENFPTLIFRSTYHLVNRPKITYYINTRSDTNDLVHPRFP